MYGVDTRELTKIVREAGVMPAAITFEPLKDLSVLKGYKVKDAVKSVTGHEIRESGPEDGKRVVLYDFGAKGNIVKELKKRGCHVIEVPADTTAEAALALHPDGIMLANGPGDPEENTAVIEEIRKFAGKLPVFGICLGHQLFALAMGGKTHKMKYGHRGANQPVRQVSTGKVFISSQNHGYEVVSDSLKGVGEVTFVNANDNTCEGVNYPGLRAFTVQFHPEACGGPHDAKLPLRRVPRRNEQGGAPCLREATSKRYLSSDRDPSSSVRRRNLTMRARRRAAF